MGSFGSATTRLIIIRGNSGSGKSTLAAAIRAALPERTVAIVGQDQLRREVLTVRDTPDNPAVGLIEQTARYAADHGFHTVVEGILHSPTYGAMVRRLAADHRGTTTAWWYDLPWEETLRRHAHKQTSSYGESELAQWWNGHDLVDGLGERQLTAEMAVDDAVDHVLTGAGLTRAAGGAARS